MKPAAIAARTSVIALWMVWSLSSAGCVGTPTAASTSAPFSQTDLAIGTGAGPTAAGNNLTVSYTGWLFDSSQPGSQGAQFDASAGFTFALGAGNVIAGWDQGLVGMRVGGRRRLVIPPSLGYGDTRHGMIPPNATLIFDVTLISVQ